MTPLLKPKLRLPCFSVARNKRPNFDLDRFGPESCRAAAGNNFRQKVIKDNQNSEDASPQGAPAD
jgi:hypothetical protein